MVGGEGQLAGPDQSWKVTHRTVLSRPHSKEQRGMVGRGPHAQPGGWTPLETPSSLSQPLVRFWQWQQEEGMGGSPNVGGISSNPPMPTSGQVFIGS